MIELEIQETGQVHFHVYGNYLKGQIIIQYSEYIFDYKMCIKREQR